MKLYLASGLENADKVKELAEYATNLGHTLTYAWWEHGSVQAQGADRIAEVGNAELDGVRDADVVLILLPGARGTHVEMGAALAFDKPTFIYGNRYDANGRECSFYYCDAAIRMNGADPKWLLNALAREKVQTLWNHSQDRSWIRSMMSEVPAAVPAFDGR